MKYMFATLRSNPAATNALTGEHHGNNPVDHRPGRERQPHGKADQDVRQYTRHDGLPEAEGGLGLRYLHDTATDAAVAGVETAAHHHQLGERHGADQVAEEHEHPIAHQRASRHASAREGHDDERVAGEQLGTTDEDENEAEREHQPSQRAGDPGGQCLVGADDCREHRTEPYERGGLAGDRPRIQAKFSSRDGDRAFLPAIGHRIAWVSNGRTALARDSKNTSTVR